MNQFKTSTKTKIEKVPLYNLTEEPHLTINKQNTRCDMLVHNCDETILAVSLSTKVKKLTGGKGKLESSIRIWNISTGVIESKLSIDPDTSKPFDHHLYVLDFHPHDRRILFSAG